MSKPTPTLSMVRAHLAAHAYADGFARGADPKRARRRHVVDSETHADWLRGYDDGRRVADAAATAYLAAQLAAEPAS
jgi:hypothetical protein